MVVEVSQGAPCANRRRKVKDRGGKPGDVATINSFDFTLLINR